MLGKLSSILRFPFVLLSSFVPKDENIWVFGAWFGRKISDNPKYFCKYIALTKSKRTIWIVKDKQLLDKKSSDDIEAYYYKSLKGIYYQLKAKKVFVTHSISSDLNPMFVSLNTQRIQMWHGVPLKKIMYDNKCEKKWWNKNIIYKAITNNFYTFVLSPSPILNDIFSSAFDVPLDRILDCGYPRNDALIIPGKIISNPAIKYHAIYMPTYRGCDESKEILFGDKYNFDFDLLETVLCENHIELTIRVHPENLPPRMLLSKIDNSNCVHLSNSDDVYEEINDFDCLITDYSSILFDFALTKKPIIFSSFDIESYLNEERSLYHPYSDITGGREAKNWNEVLKELILLRSSSGDFTYGPFLEEFCKLSTVAHGENFSDKLYERLDSHRMG